MPQAYSYIRFSSPKQQLGDSIRRQEKLARDYAEHHGLTLDTSSYRDLGISAFKGKNATDGNLRRFLEAIESGIIRKGSYLLVESLDRISRNDVDEALELFLSIIRKGIVVVTLEDQQEYSQARIRQDKGISLIISIARMSRANEESAVKSLRVKAAWQAKRESGKPMTAVGPAWLKLSEARDEWVINQDRALVVRRIFDLAKAGNGSPSIARTLNSDGVPTFGRSKFWSFGTVASILKNSAVIGVFTPKKAWGDPIIGYYPAIIDETDFRAVQRLVEKRRWVGGRNTENVTNIFAGISFCHVCGARMRTVGGDHRSLYLQCLRAYSKDGCEEGRFPYIAAERAVLWKIAMSLSRLMSKSSLNENPRIKIEEALQDHRERLQKLLDVAESAPDSQSIAQRIVQIENQVLHLERQLETQPESSEELIDKAKMGYLYDTMRGAGSSIDRAMRLELKSYVSVLLKSVEFWCDAENDRPSVGITFADEFGGDLMGIDVKRFMDPYWGFVASQPTDDEDAASAS